MDQIHCCSSTVRTSGTVCSSNYNWLIFRPLLHDHSRPILCKCMLLQSITFNIIILFHGRIVMHNGCDFGSCDWALWNFFVALYCILICTDCSSSFEKSSFTNKTETRQKATNLLFQFSRHILHLFDSVPHKQKDNSLNNILA